MAFTLLLSPDCDQQLGQPCLMLQIAKSHTSARASSKASNRLWQTRCPILLRYLSATPTCASPQLWLTSRFTPVFLCYHLTVTLYFLFSLSSPRCHTQSLGGLTAVSATHLPPPPPPPFAACLKAVSRCFVT